jgi:outer membrane protein assembly factor BamB
MKGSVSVDAYVRPLLAVGQGISKLASKTGAIGLHVYYLTDGTEAFLLNGRKSSKQVQYTTNGAFDGTPLFLYDSDAMVVAGENGLLYTVDMNSKFVYPTAEEPDAEPSMKVNPTVTYLRTKADAEKDAQVGVESSAAMYDKYIFMADTYGVVRCVDSDTMKTVWAMDGGDNIDAAIALDMDSESSVSLYTGNTAYSRLGSKKDVTIRRMNALTGETLWTYEIKCDYDKNQLSGCKASPVIGQNRISDLVYFTVNKVSGGGSKLLALDKQTGRLVWEYAMKDESISSPVAVYNDSGDAWIVQGDQGGNLTLLNARTGSARCTLNLGGPIEASPAVYKNYLVIGTCGKTGASMFGIEIK